jgi:Domain of unknown function (DUF4105)
MRISRWAFAFAGVLLLILLMIGMTGWGALALYYSDLGSPALRMAAAGLFGLIGLAALIGQVSRRWRWRALLAYAVLFAALVAWWNTIPPSNDRLWQPEVAVLPYATIEGDHVTVHNIRNFDYRTETDFTPAYYDKTYDMRKLDSVDLLAVYWMGPAIAHTFVSFGFGGKDYLAVSIETRKEQGEGYSTLKGFFKQYELYYVVADERDVIRVRTNYRRDPPEEVYLYRLRGTQESGQKFFMEYMNQINALKEHPEFYNTATTNCTTTIWFNSMVNPGHLPFSWKLLLSGHVPEYLYDRGRLDTTLPFNELQKRSLINSRAQSADPDPDFSQRIRKGLPGF